MLRNSTSALLIIFVLLLIDPSSTNAVDFKDQQERLEYQRSIPLTIWPDNVPGKPMTYDEWKAIEGDPQPFELITNHSLSPDKRIDPVPFGILVNSTLYSYIETSLDQYIADLNSDGYDVKVHQISGGQPSDIRILLQDEYATGMAGCVLIGDLPVPWYETKCWDSAYTSFPIDLYYMDLDGSWDDTDLDGRFDSHTGDRGPEIWLGRLTASRMIYGGATEIALLENYFEKNHRYRTGQNFLNNRALVYIDDDWEYWAGEWGGNVGLAYPERTTVSDGAETRKVDYEARLTDNYESVLLCCHSGPTCHSFKIGSDWTGGSTCYNDIVNIDPPAHFYNLFACSNARYVEYNYMGGWYIFYDSDGLASIGSTKTGSMLHFGYFYGPFGIGKNIGEAFLDWFDVIASWGFPQEDLCWFYGMTLCGDPTLKHLIPDPVTLENESLPDGQADEPYNETLTANGGMPPYHWSITSGSLPDGLILNSSTGEISGTPILNGLFEFTVLVEDDGIPSVTDIKDLSINITYLCGDANQDGETNILDIIYLIAYLYKSGPAPDPFGSGDVNRTYTINILDVTHFIAFMYQGGAPLSCMH